MTCYDRGQGTGGAYSMADEEQLAILGQGSQAWNVWREKREKQPHFIRPNLSQADLCKANLSVADLSAAHLNGANLSAADLRGANLIEANLSGARLYKTVLADLDLSSCKGLDSCAHDGPSIIDHRTLQRSGQLPLVFLRGVGLPDNLIDYLPSLLNQPFQFYSCSSATARRTRLSLSSSTPTCRPKACAAGSPRRT
jgi:Pentapeptide repeats (8 copies)